MRLRTFIALIGAASAVSVAGVPVASADESCATGYVCTWSANNYQDYRTNYTGAFEGQWQQIHRRSIKNRFTGRHVRLKFAGSVFCVYAGHQRPVTEFDWLLVLPKGAPC